MTRRTIQSHAEWLRHRERMGGTITITRNEILCGLNKPDAFILALVEIDGDAGGSPVYVRRPFGREPDFGVTSVNDDLRDLGGRGGRPT